MLRSRIAVLLVVGLLLTPLSTLDLVPPVALAQDMPELPGLGKVVLEDPLTGTGPFRTRTCETGRNAAEFAPDGYLTRVTGRCMETSTIALLGTVAAGLTVGNGEISVDARIAEGYERTWLTLYFREQTNGDTYFVSWLPSQGRMDLRKAIGSITAQLGTREDLGIAEPEAWTRLAVRTEGQRMWVLVNDQPVMSASDPSLARGAFAIGVGRTGSLDDDAPSVAVWRNLRVTALANEPPSASSGGTGQSAASTGPFTPAPGTPPAPGRVVHEESLAQRGIIPVGSCRNGKGRGEVVGEGFLLAVNGRCNDSSTSVGVSPTLPGLSVPDGEVRIDFKITRGFDRTSLALGTRWSGSPGGGYIFRLSPRRGAAIVKSQQGQPTQTLAERNDVESLVRRDDWNTMVVRVHGSSLWLLVNDQPVLSTDDGAYGTGEVWLGLGRLGSPDDDEEVAVLFREFRVSAIEGAADDRAPTYTQPPGQPSGPGSVLSLAPWPLPAAADAVEAAMVTSRR